MKTAFEETLGQYQIDELIQPLSRVDTLLNTPSLQTADPYKPEWLGVLNRAVESRQDHRPQLADLRESGVIEQDADVVMLLMRPDYYEKEVKTNIAELNIAKQRNGPVGGIKLRFFEEITRFESSSQREEIDEYFEE